MFCFLQYIYAKEKVYVTPSTIGPGLLNPPNCKTGYSTPWTFQNRPNNPPRRFWRVVLSFSFLFISAESLKNHNKSQKNSKIENQILLDSTWVDPHSKHIIWFSFIQSFCCRFRYMFLMQLNRIIHSCIFHGPIVVKFLWWAKYCMLEL